MTRAHRPCDHGAKPPRSFDSQRELIAAKKRAERERNMERRIQAGEADHRIRGGIRHPLDCPCYDCLWHEDP